MAAAGTAAILGWLGSWTRAALIGTFLAIGMSLFSGGWHVRQRMRFPCDRQGLQARRDLTMRGLLGLFYFGALLGFALLTAISTPLVYAGLAFAFSAGPWVGGSYGIGFAIGRSAPALIGVFWPISQSRSPARVVGRVAGGFHQTLRWGGIATALGMIAVSLAPYVAGD